jgi:hypothetical protein
MLAELRRMLSAELSDVTLSLRRIERRAGLRRPSSANPPVSSTGCLPAWSGSSALSVSSKTPSRPEFRAAVGWPDPRGRDV